jgi:hypothetical protein
VVIEFKSFRLLDEHWSDRHSLFTPLIRYLDWSLGVATSGNPVYICSQGSLIIFGIFVFNKITTVPTIFYVIDGPHSVES